MPEAGKVAAESENIEQGKSKKIKLESDGDTILSEKITRQLDYYFSDANIVKDKFLRAAIEKDDGWVDLSTLMTFSRLKDLTTDEGRILAALDQHKPEVIEVNEKKKVRRKDPLPDIEEYQRQLDLRTVHISGFPTNYKFENLRQYCSQFGEIESLNMRLHFKTRFFKGCIHVAYKKEEDAKKVLAEDVLKCKDRELRCESMEQYHKRKAEMAQKRLENKKKKQASKGE